MRLATSHPLVEELIGLSFILNTFAAVWVYTVLTPAALEATKALVRLVLQREREGNLGAPAGLRQQLDAVPKEALLAAIRRHRLECLLHGDPIVASLLPELAATLQVLARQDAMAALALASLTREMAALFEQAAMPMLVIKGIPLALQTTGSLTSRGRGDLDLLVDPKRLPAAVALLESVGFEKTYGPSCMGTDSPQGKYSQFVSIELSLVRLRGQRQWIDLHWHVSHARGVLPTFNGLWNNRDYVDINGTSVATLSLENAFVHACCHAAADCWMCIRNLVDVERLTQRLNPQDLEALQKKRLVRKTSAVANNCVTNPILQSKLVAPPISTYTRSLCAAREAQILPWRSLGTGEWTFRNRIKYSLRLLNLSRHPAHLASMLMQHLIPPDLLLSQETGETISIGIVILRRVHKLIWRIRGGDVRPPHPACRLPAASKPCQPA